MILICYGTRPEWLKLKPVIERLDRSEYFTLFTGQHKDLVKGLNFDFWTVISEGKNRLDQVISTILSQFPDDKRIDSILVQGDTASAFACSIAAFHRNLQIFYLESGLRTHDITSPYPEEGYRQMIARIANYNFCPTNLSKHNLEKENVTGKIFVTGNTVLDNLVGVDSYYSNKVLITIHRRENHKLIKDWFIKLEKIAIQNPELQFILPIHPNPEVQKHKNILHKVQIVEPLDYVNLIELLRSVKLVITDSGGLQEEGSFLNKRVIVCRKETERPEGIDTGHIILCKDPENLNSVFNYTIKNYSISNPCPYGDGKSSQRIVDVIRSRI